jgi:hypothetical protein
MQLLLPIAKRYDLMLQVGDVAGVSDAVAAECLVQTRWNRTAAIALARPLAGLDEADALAQLDGVEE